MNGRPRRTRARPLKQRPNPPCVRSAFDLPPEQRAAIENALNETFSADIQVRFETAPDMISGIELSANGQKVAWSIADYLATLEKSVGELLQKEDKPAQASQNAMSKSTQSPSSRSEDRTEAHESSRRIRVDPTEAASRNRSNSEPKLKSSQRQAMPRNPRQTGRR